MHYQDWVIPAGTPVSQMNYVVNNDPEIFPQPLEFRPDRWIEAERAGIRLDRYMVSWPFGSIYFLPISLYLTREGGEAIPMQIAHLPP